MFEPKSFSLGVFVGMVFMAICILSFSSTKSPEITTISLEQEITSIELEKSKCTVRLFDITIFQEPRFVSSHIDLKSCEGLKIGDKVTVMMRITE